MAIYTEIGETIKGDKIIAEARKIDNVKVITKSGRHKAQRTVLRDNPICYVNKRIRSLK